MSTVTGRDAARKSRLAMRRSAIAASSLWRAANLAEALDGAAAAYPGRPCIIAGDHRYRYREVARWSHQVAQGLLRLGARPGDRIAVLLAGGPEFIVLQYAIARIGGTSVPVNFRLKPPELHYILAQSRSNLLVAADTVRGVNVVDALDQLYPRWQTAGGGEAAPDLRKVVILDQDSLRDGPATSLRPFAATGTAPALVPAQPLPGPSATAAIFYTSGTTGAPKGVMLSHEALLRSAYGSALTRGFQDGRIILTALPLYHVFAYVEGMLASLFSGGAIAALPRFAAADLLAAADDCGACDLLAVPTMLIDLVNAAARKEYDLSTLTDLMCAGSPAPEPLWQRAADALGLEFVVQGYGMTETSASATMTRPEDPLAVTAQTVGQPKDGGSAGLPRLQGALCEYRTIDPDTGILLPAGAEGELAGRGPAMTTGYYQKPAETAATVTPDGWIRSGDLGRILPDGRLQITGRAKELYRCGGESVSPREVEAVLTRCPGVSQAYVVGIPDDRLGEIGAAWVVPDAGSPVDEQAVTAFCRANLADYKVPRHVLPIAPDSLPLTTTGKVQKFRLAQWATARISQPAAERHPEEPHGPDRL